MLLRTFIKKFNKSIKIIDNNSILKDKIIHSHLNKKYTIFKRLSSKKNSKSPSIFYEGKMQKVFQKYINK